MALLAGCGETAKPVGTVGFVKGFGGMVAADEPRAVLAARDILSAGGTAADAAVALYFTMAVTLPSTASLGGGGVCVVYDKEKKRTEVVEFLAPPSVVSGQARTPSAVPANVRGFYALHAKYGKFRWEQLLSDAERLARMGVPVSRAFANDIARGAQLLANDPAARQVFMPGGKPLAEGQNFEQHDLAAVLARVRRAPGELYGGNLAREFTAAVARAGGSLTAEDLRDLKPGLRDALAVSVGDDTAFFAPPPAVAGGVAAVMTASLVDRWGRAPAEEKPHLLAEASARAFADRARWMQANGWPNEQAATLATRERAGTLLNGYNSERHIPVEAAKATDAIPATGFVVMDSFGDAVACNVTTYGLFGNGRMAPGTGIILAAVPGLSSGPPAIGPVLVINVHSREVHFAGAASGGVTAPSALVQTLMTTTIDGVAVDKAVAAPRVHHSGTPDLAFVEAGETPMDAAPLTKRGHEIKAVPMPSRVNAFACVSGAADFKNCRIATDPRGSGLGVVVGKD